MSEKSELQTALVHTQQAVRQKAGGSLGALSSCSSEHGQTFTGTASLGFISVIAEVAEDLAGRLQSSQQRIRELEQKLSAVSMQQKRADRVSPAASLRGTEPPGPFCRMEGLAAQKAAWAISCCFKAVWLLEGAWG